MTLKSILKKIVPVSFAHTDTQYEKLQKQNEQMMQLLSKNQKKVTQQLREIESLVGFGQYGVTKEKRSTQVIVSLTSYGDRIYTLPTVLERLLCQTLKPDRIIVYLSTEDFPERELAMPPRLLEMQQYGVELRWCEGNIKSYKKIIPALKEFPDDIIITVDDDLYYRLDMVERLYCAYMRFPNAISTLRVHKMTFDENGSLRPYAQWKKVYKKEILSPSLQLFATTGAGTLFPPHCLHEDVCKEELFMRLAPNADDVWMKMMSLLADTPVLLAGDVGGLQFVEGTQKDRLWDVNIIENDNQIKRVIEWYHDTNLLKGVQDEADRSGCKENK